LGPLKKHTQLVSSATAAVTVNSTELEVSIYSFEYDHCLFNLPNTKVYVAIAVSLMRHASRVCFSCCRHLYSSCDNIKICCCCPPD